MSAEPHDAGGIEVVRGGAAPEELAAVVAVLTARAEQAASASASAGPSGYAAWRARRMAALRRTGRIERA